MIEFHAETLPYQAEIVKYYEETTLYQAETMEDHAEMIKYLGSNHFRKDCIS